MCTDEPGASCAGFAYCTVISNGLLRYTVKFFVLGMASPTLNTVVSLTGLQIGQAAQF